MNGIEPPEGWLGKPWALHQASRRASGELLLFVDADVIYAPAAVSTLVARLERSGVEMLSLFPRFEMQTLGELTGLPMLAFTVFSVMPLWFSNRTKYALLALGGGPGNLVRRTAYVAAGGHEALHDAVIDDVALARLIRRSGGATECVRGEELVSLRMYHGTREVIEGFTKNAFASLGNRLTLSFLFLVLTITFHLAPYALALTGSRLGIATVVLISLTRLILFAAIGYPLWAALVLHPPMIVLWSWIMVRSAWFNGVRRQLRWRGRTYDAGRTRFGAD